MNVALMRLLSRLLSSDFTAGGRKGREPYAGLLLAGTVLVILLCAFSGNAVFTFSVVVVLLLLLSFFSPGEIGRVLKTALLAALAAGIFLLPSVLLGSPRSFGTVVLKVFESVLVLSMLREWLSWKELTAALGRWHLPELVIWTLDMTVRFLVLLGRYSNAVLEAVSLRRVGDADWRNAGTGGILGNTFLKAGNLSKETGEAMACRCWDGSFERAGAASAGPGRRAVLAAAAACALLLFWFGLTQSWMVR